MNLKNCLACVLSALLLCGAGWAQGADPAADPDKNKGEASAASADKDAAPKARVLKGGTLTDAAGEGGAAEGDGKAPAPSGKDSASTFKIEGDTVLLKSGKQLRGVKVLRVTPSSVELEYTAGQPAMKIPRRLVTNIEYMNPANATAATSAGDEKAGSGDVMVAEEISAEFNKKLTAPIPGTPLDFKDQDALTVLKDLADRAQVALTVDPEAQKVPETQRKLTLSVPPAATLSTLLREGFQTAVPALKFSLQFDKVVVTSTEAEALKAAGPVPPGLAPPPAPK